MAVRHSLGRLPAGRAAQRSWRRASKRGRTFVTRKQAAQRSTHLLSLVMRRPSGVIRRRPICSSSGGGIVEQSLSDAGDQRGLI